MNKALNLLVITLFMIFMNASASSNPTFQDDLKTLSPIGDITILKDGDAQIAICGKFQGRVLTSTSQGPNGKSLGWFNKDVIKEGETSTSFNQLGGESRMWFGPEIGKYGIFFDPGKEQTVENIKISPDLSNRLFAEIEKTPSSLTADGEMKIRNANGYVFDLYAKRKISLISTEEILKDLNTAIMSDQVSTVAFKAETWIRNKGKEAWTKEKGVLSIWDIGCLHPSEQSVVIIPVHKNPEQATIYFTEIDNSRIQIKDNVVFYKSDANYLNKIGIQPEHCKDVFGSYSPELNLLTIVKYSFKNDGPYVNSVWGHTNPYKGDVINIFNGEVTPELDRNWPFYEVETSSSAKELKPEEEMYHQQSIYHFEGDQNALNEIAQNVLGVSLPEAMSIF